MSILCYHAVDPTWRSALAVSPDVFAQHCAWLGRHRRVASLTEVVGRMNGSARLPRGVSVLTFDDGFAGVHTHAFPLLLQHRLPATMFLVAETLTAGGPPLGWGGDPPRPPLATPSPNHGLGKRAAGLQIRSPNFPHPPLHGPRECQV